MERTTNRVLPQDISHCTLIFKSASGLDPTDVGLPKQQREFVKLKQDETKAKTNRTEISNYGENKKYLLRQFYIVLKCLGPMVIQPGYIFM